jgi:ParB family chromosome partitioning protein
MAAAQKAVAAQAVVPVELLKPNPWNTNVVSPENERRLEESLKRFAEFGGFFKPVTVRTLPNGTLEILGGQHRWEAARRLGIKEVPIFNVGAISDKLAKEIGLADNGRYGEDDPLALAKLLATVDTKEELAKFLPYSDLDLQNLFSASSIDLDALGLDGEEQRAPESPARPPATHQVMRFKVPVEDIAVVTERIEKVMRENNYTAEDSLSNAGAALVHIIKKG